MSNPTAAVAFAALIAVLLPACKTQRTETWTSVSADSNNPFGSRMFSPLNDWARLKELESVELDKLSRRKRREVEAEMAQLQSAADHPLTSKNTSADKLFGSRSNTQFNNEFRTKEFLGGKKYEAENSRFFDGRKQAAVSDKRFFGSNRSAGEDGRLWFGRNKSVAQKAAAEGDRRFATSDYARGDSKYPTSDYADAADGHDSIRDVLNPRGSGYDPRSLSIDEVRELLGR